MADFIGSGNIGIQWYFSEKSPGFIWKNGRLPDFWCASATDWFYM